MECFESLECTLLNYGIKLNSYSLVALVVVGISLCCYPKYAIEKESYEKITLYFASSCFTFKWLW